MPAQSKTSRIRIRGKLLEEKALQLRLEGYSYGKIAEACGVHKNAAWSAVQRALIRLQKQIDETAELVRRMELERLDLMLVPMMKMAIKGNQGAVDRALRIMERRARLLGLDAPQRMEMRDVTKEEETLEEMLATAQMEAEQKLIEDGQKQELPLDEDNDS